MSAAVEAAGRPTQAGERAGERAEERAGELAEELVGAGAVRGRLAELGAGAVSQVLAFRPGSGRPTGVAEQRWDEELLGRGVELRVLVVDAVRGDPSAVAYARRLVGLGGQVRTVSALPLRMVVLDRETAVLPLDPGRADTAAVLHGPGPVAALGVLFDGLWHGAAPLCHPRGRDRNGLTAQHYTLLRILQRGDTDMVAARKLGVSERTVRRLAAEALEVLGARSRFQAGARAAERGWLR
ncbi:LuxR family transcriptional regulator [Kitasatospora sp. NPDC088783]|uniref:LuxR family transcriptional regulator n=1 Tax=Kitasatospora sp. NPDC088783 TaxID=3364077 RepID=UPI0037FB9470